MEETKTNDSERILYFVLIHRNDKIVGFSNIV